MSGLESLASLVVIVLLIYALVGHFEADDWRRPALWLAVGGIDMLRAGLLLGEGKLYGWVPFALGVACLTTGWVLAVRAGKAVKR